MSDRQFEQWINETHSPEVGIHKRFEGTSWVHESDYAAVLAQKEALENRLERAVELLSWSSNFSQTVGTVWGNKVDEFLGIKRIFPEAPHEAK